jgi:hypothetical protein
MHSKTKSKYAANDADAAADNAADKDVVVCLAPGSIADFVTKTERAYGQAHLREERASKIWRGVELLIARWAQVT